LRPAGQRTSGFPHAVPTHCARRAHFSLCGWAFAQDDTEARRLLDADRTEEAIGAYTRLLSSSPRHPDWLLLRGIAHSRNKQ